MPTYYQKLKILLPIFSDRQKIGKNLKILFSVNSIKIIYINIVLGSTYYKKLKILLAIFADRRIAASVFYYYSSVLAIYILSIKYQF